MGPERGVCVRNRVWGAEGRKVEKLPGLGFYSEKGHRWRIWSRGGGWDLTWAGRLSWPLCCH